MNIRKVTMADAPLIHEELGCNAEMISYTGWNPYITLESTQQFLADAIDSDENYSWVIEDGGEVVGTIGAYDYNPEDCSIELGYSIFQKHWGKGFASYAVALACEVLTSAKHIECIRAWCVQENIASMRVLEKNGFHKINAASDAINVNGVQSSKVFYLKRK